MLGLIIESEISVKSVISKFLAISQLQVWEKVKDIGKTLNFFDKRT